jgi:hypothetical protein
VRDSERKASFEPHQRSATDIQIRRQKVKLLSRQPAPAGLDRRGTPKAAIQSAFPLRFVSWQKIEQGCPVFRHKIYRSVNF